MLQDFNRVSDVLKLKLQKSEHNIFLILFKNCWKNDNLQRTCLFFLKIKKGELLQTRLGQFMNHHLQSKLYVCQIPIFLRAYRFTFVLDS